MIRTAIIEDDPDVMEQIEAAIARSDDIEIAWIARNEAVFEASSRGILDAH